MTTKIPVPMLDSSVSQLFGMRNRIINGGFTINQRVYVTNTALASGVYAHDRWKAGSGGCTYTFTQASAGVNTTITIAVGTLVQVIEGCNVPEGGTYTLSWTGTAQARINAGSYAASPITVAGLTAGSNLTVEFATGTVGSVQLERGSTPTTFDYRLHGVELMLCQRYYEKSIEQSQTPGTSVTGSFSYDTVSGQNARMFNSFVVTKRIAPTPTVYSSLNGASGNVNFNGASQAAVASATQTRIAWNTTGTTGSNGYVTGYWTADAEI